MAKLHFAKRETSDRFPEYLVWEYEDGSLRLGMGTYRDLRYPGTFTAAGKQYSSCKELCAEQIEAHGRYMIYRDIYGQKIFIVQHEFPQRYSFDDMPWLGNDRFYWEFFIMQDDRICMIRYESRSTQIQVYDDVERLSDLDWKKMLELKWIKAPL